MCAATIGVYATVLITKWGLVGPIRAVRDAVTEEIQIDTDIVARALPLPKGTAKSLGRAVLLVTHIPAVIVPVTGPRSEDAVSVVTEEVSWGAGLRDAAIVLVRAVDTVGMSVTLPGVGDAGAIALALELIWVAHTGRPGWTAGLVGVVFAINNPITTKSAANARAPVSASELRARAV